MIQTGFLLFIGLLVLLTAGEVLVRGAASLAKIARIPPLVIGLTVVAFGTSAPELVVTVEAVIGGAAGIAMGNIIGSNIANILLVLGLPAILTPISMTVPRLRRHAVALGLGSLLFAAVVYLRGGIGTAEALALSLGMLAYFALMAYEASTGRGELLADELEDLTARRTGLPKTLFFVAVGLVGLPLGAALLVDNGKILAEALGVRDELIGLTVVAFGTSLPELATVLAAAIKKDADVAAGSIIGSNIFNMMFVGSAAGFVGTTRFTEQAMGFDLPVMLGATVLVMALVFLRRDFGRLLGALTVLAYLGYIAAIGAKGLA